MSLTDLPKHHMSVSAPLPLHMASCGEPDAPVYFCPQETLLFRPSGGDTMAQTRTAVSKLITWEGQHYAWFSVAVSPWEVLQALAAAAPKDFLQSLIFSAQESYAAMPLPSAYAPPVSSFVFRRGTSSPPRAAFTIGPQKRGSADACRITDIFVSCLLRRPDFIVFGFTVCHLAPFRQKGEEGILQPPSPNLPRP